MPATHNHTVALIGAGTIGISWATLFAAWGSRVVVHDPRPDVADVVRDGLRQFAPSLPDGPARLAERVTTAPGAEEAVAGADVVQENGPENIEVKRELFARIGRAAPPHALLLSSTSGLQPTDIARDMPDAAAARMLVGHPFNPPHLLPLVEVVPGERTDPTAAQSTVDFYTALGKKPVVLRREAPGFVANRLQSALFRESVNLVLQGVVSPEELDTVVTESLGVRWATGGPFLSLHLGGGPGGLRYLLEHLGPGMARRWRDLGQPQLDEDTVNRLADAAERAFGDRGYRELTEDRDRQEIAVLAARARARAATA
jgi:ketoreductase RED1